MTTIPQPTNTVGTNGTPKVDAEALATAVDRAREAMAPLDEDIRRRAEALVKARESFLAAGVREMIRRLKSDDRSREVLFELVDDPLVYAVLLELGVVKPDVTTRVARAMERIGPYVASHGGKIGVLVVDTMISRDRAPFRRMWKPGTYIRVKSPFS